LLIAADMSARLQHLADADVERIRRLLERAGLPVAAPRIGADSALGYMRIDKKVKAGRVRLVLLERIGQATFTGSYPDAVLDATLKANFG
jgi:3-dehydroquinate synthase